MVAQHELRQKIRKLDRAGLKKLWKQMRNGGPAGWDHGKAFEFLVLRAFELEKADVIWPFEVRAGGATLEQIDGVIYVGSLACLIESKDLQGRVNFEPIAKLRQQLSRRPPATVGCCFARNGFTSEAILLTQRSTPQNVLLWDGTELEFAFSRGTMCKGLVAKYRHSVEQALPDLRIDTLKL